LASEGTSFLREDHTSFSAVPVNLLDQGDKS
jgi:hypothetical protein